MGFLCSFLKRHFAGKLLVASRNISCFLRLLRANFIYEPTTIILHKLSCKPCKKHSGKKPPEKGSRGHLRPPRKLFPFGPPFPSEFLSPFVRGGGVVVDIFWNYTILVHAIYVSFCGFSLIPSPLFQ